MLSGAQKDLIGKISKENGFKDFSVLVEQGSKKGDNYLGNIFSIKVKENGTDKEKNYILKCAETNENVRSQLSIHEVYQREIFLYQEVLPVFDKFQEKYRIRHPFKAFTKVLDSSTEDGNEYLLMEDIKYAGFRMLQRRKAMDSQHISFVFKELAKLHSLSLALKYLEPETYNKLAEKLEDYFEKNEDLIKSYMEALPKKIDMVLKVVHGHPKAVQALTNLQINLMELFLKCKNKDYHLVIIHGDPWCNNMMFKYDNQAIPSNPTSMCFLDWQISRINSPVADLCYFLFFSALKETLDKHQEYLNIYYQIVDENLKSINCDTKSIFPYELLKQHWNIYSKMGLITAISTMHIILKDEKDAKSFTEMLGEKGNENKIWNELWKDERLSDECLQRLRDIILMMVENNYL